MPFDKTERRRSYLVWLLLYNYLYSLKTLLAWCDRFDWIAFKCWQAILLRFPKIELAKFVAMPDCTHGILMMDNYDGRSKAMLCLYKGKFGKPIAGSIPTIVGSLKSAVSRQINVLRNLKGRPVWQRNYYEHIVRDEQSLI